ncbi:hypothetical protein T484DRAFT_1781616 [Baffinella frigidus]|nr:hypothetical protein T484DRAFT_1781616 [Cryptophyta sp. CCMP2293]
MGFARNRETEEQLQESKQKLQMESIIGTTKVLRILRILRVFKLTRHSEGLIVLLRTARACQKELLLLLGLIVLLRTARACQNELSLLLFCLAVLSIIFSSLVFLAEENFDHKMSLPFKSIPHTLW